MVGHALAVGEQVVEREAVVERALAGLQAVDVVQLHLVAEVVDELLERLDVVGRGDVVVEEGVDRDLEDARHGGEHDLQLARAGGRKDDLLRVELLRRLADVERVVADALEVADRVQVLRHVGRLARRELLARNLDEVGAELVLVVVDGFLVFLQGGELLVTELVEQGERGQDVVLRLMGHGVDGQAALLDGQRRVREKALLEPVDVGERAGGRFVREQERDELFQQGDHRREQQHGRKAEDRVEQGDAHGGHGRVRKREVHGCVDRVEHDAPDDRADDVDEQVDIGGALALDARAEGGQQHRHGRADGDAERDGEGHGERDRARDGQRLQDADGGRRALQDAGEHRADEHAEQRVGKAGQQLDERGAVLERGHGAAHGGHAVHEHGEAEQNVADVVFGQVLAEHAQHDADHGDDTRERRGAQQRHPAGAADVRQAEDPARDARAEDGAEHDADGLAHLHHAGVDEADDHDGRGRGRLDHGGDARAEQDALERGAREFIEYDLELVAGHFLQPVAHERHAEQEQGHAAKQRDHVIDPQNASRSLCDIFALTSHYSRKRCKDKCWNCICT